MTLNIFLNKKLLSKALQDEWVKKKVVDVCCCSASGQGVSFSIQVWVDIFFCFVSAFLSQALNLHQLFWLQILKQKPNHTKVAQIRARTSTSGRTPFLNRRNWNETANFQSMFCAPNSQIFSPLNFKMVFKIGVNESFQLKIRHSNIHLRSFSHWQTLKKAFSLCENQ